jgi:hypothetical protein
VLAKYPNRFRGITPMPDDAYPNDECGLIVL